MYKGKTVEEKFIGELFSMNLQQLKDAYYSVSIEDDYMGISIHRPDTHKQKLIFDQIVQLIADTDDDYDPESGEPEPDWKSAAQDFLDRE
jgi:hypothetical protein